MSASTQYLSLCEAILSDGNALRIRARGHSMHPVIRDGDEVRISPVAPDDVRVGDILCFRSQLEIVVVHRVIGIRTVEGRVYFRMKGDLALVVESVPAAAVLGRVVEVGREDRAWSMETPRARLFARLLALGSYPFTIVYLALVKTKRFFLGVFGRRNDTR